MTCEIKVESTISITTFEKTGSVKRKTTYKSSTIDVLYSPEAFSSMSRMKLTYKRTYGVPYPLTLFI